MINITVIHVGNIKDKFFADAVAEYEKRIKGYCKIKSIEIKEKSHIVENLILKHKDCVVFKSKLKRTPKACFSKGCFRKKPIEREISTVIEK